MGQGRRGTQIPAARRESGPGGLKELRSIRAGPVGDHWSKDSARSPVDHLLAEAAQRRYRLRSLRGGRGFGQLLVHRGAATEAGHELCGDRVAEHIARCSISMKASNPGDQRDRQKPDLIASGIRCRRAPRRDLGTIGTYGARRERPTPTLDRRPPRAGRLDDRPRLAPIARMVGRSMGWTERDRRFFVISTTCGTSAADIISAHARPNRFNRLGIR
jgi:hypothetical protein